MATSARRLADYLFNADTRYLARLELVLDDVQPLLLGSNLRDDNSALAVDLTNPDIYRNGRIVLQKGRGGAADRAAAIDPVRRSLRAGECKPAAAKAADAVGSTEGRPMSL